MTTYFSILAWEICGQQILIGFSPWGHTELDTTEPHGQINKMCLLRNRYMHLVGIQYTADIGDYLQNVINL